MGLRGAGCRLLEGAYHRLARQPDLEIIAALAVGALQKQLRGNIKIRRGSRLSDQSLLGGRYAPRFVSDAAQGNARLGDPPLFHSKGGGHGIGAYQARELVRDAGGDLLVLSRPNAGTTMRVILPSVRPSVAEPASAEA